MSGAIRHDRGTSNALLEASLYALLILLSRFVILAAISWLVDGREFTDDVAMHMRMVRAPLDLLFGMPGSDAQHPPLLGLAEAVLAYPLQAFLPDFLAIRIAYMLYEGMTAFFFWLLLVRLVPDAGARLIAALGFVLAPAAWMSTAVMPQDEIIACFVLTLVLWLHVEGYPRAALLACGLGVVTAKIFMAVPLLALILLAPPAAGVVSRALVGLAPAAAVYALSAVAAARNGGATPLIGFTPGNEFAINLWVPLMQATGMLASTARRLSSLAALAGGLAPMVLLRLRSGSVDALTLAGAMAASLLWVFALFYHVNPEYYVILLPALLLTARKALPTLAVSALMVAPWVANFFYGVSHAIQQGITQPGKSRFIDLYRSVTSIDPAALFTLSLWGSVLATFGLAVYATMLAMGQDRRRA